MLLALEVSIAVFSRLLHVAEEPPVIPPLNWEEDMQLFSQFTDRKVGSRIRDITAFVDIIITVIEVFQLHSFIFFSLSFIYLSM